MANPHPTPKLENLRRPWPPGTSGNPAGYSRGRRISDAIERLISVLPRDLVSVEVAAGQVGAHPETLLIMSTFPVLYPVLAPERGPRWQTHVQRRKLGISVRPGHPAPAATLPAIPAAGESATPSRD